MKKTLAVVMVLGAIITSACTYPTCPTYSKSPSKQTKESRI